MGGVVTKPGIVTSVVETAECLLDQRHLDADKLAAMLDAAKSASEHFARDEDIEVEWERIWNIQPILFDDSLIELADEAINDVAGTSHRLPSGPVARRCRGGACRHSHGDRVRAVAARPSHTKLEDTKEEHLELAVEALDRLATKTIARAAGG